MPNSFTEPIVAGRLPVVAQQGHKDRLSAIDASFLHQEKQSSHMHVGALAVFEGPPPAREEFCGHLESRLGRVPRYRQKLAFPPLETGRPFWVDDPTFNLDYHVRHTALPKPGSDDQLRQLVGRIFSQRLDRSKPLWEIWIVQGLEGGRFALISKTHHALVDGVSGVDIATVLFDLSPVPRRDRGRGPLDAGPGALRRRARGRGRGGPGAHAVQTWPGARSARFSARPRRSAACARRPRASARSSGPG